MIYITVYNSYPATREDNNMEDKPFPWTCGHCNTKTVLPEDQQVSMKCLHQGRLIPIHIPCMSVPTCVTCKAKFFSLKEDDQIQEEVQKQYKLIQLKEKITTVINKLSLESLSDTPDWIIAEYLKRCLENFSTIVKMRDSYYSEDRRPNHDLSSNS